MLLRTIPPLMAALAFVAASLGAQGISTVDTGSVAELSHLVAKPAPVGATLRAAPVADAPAPPRPRCTAGRVAHRAITHVPTGTAAGALLGYLTYHAMTMGWSNDRPSDYNSVRRKFIAAYAVIGAALAVKDIVDECRGRPPYIVGPVRP